MNEFLFIVSFISSKDILRFGSFTTSLTHPSQDIKDLPDTILPPFTSKLRLIIL